MTEQASNATLRPGPNSGLFSAMGSETTSVSELVFQDDLTGLYNRRYLREFLAHHVDWDTSSANPLSILMIDVDHFKQVNDVHGHLTGDRVLVHVAQVLRSSFRDSDLVVRYAGDEFLVVLPDADSQTAFTLAQRALGQFRDFPYTCEDGKQEISVSISIGVATFPQDARSPEELIERVDKALYISKREGRDRATLAPSDQLGGLTKDDLFRNFPCPVFVGREDWQSKLRAYLPGAEPRRTPLVVIEGESGIGKTRLLTELVNQTEDEEILWLVERCTEEYREVPYHVLTALIKQLNMNYPDIISSVIESIPRKEVRCLFEHIPELAANRPQNGPAGGGATGEKREVLFKAFATFLCSISVHAPLALLIDEFQHVDMGTLSVLLALHTRPDTRVTAFAGLTASSLADPCLRGSPLVTFCEIASSENEELFVELPLPSLGKEAISQMISGIFPGREASPEFDDALYHLSQGNPLYLEANLKDMIGRGFIQHSGERWQLDLPPEGGEPGSLDEAIRRHLGKLDAETAAMLARAAVIGPRFGLDVLKTITGANTGHALGLLDKARRAAVVASVPGREDEELSFTSPRVRDVTYEVFDPDERKRTHNRLAEEQMKRHMNRSDAVASMLAFHFKRAGNGAKAHRFEEKAKAYAKDIFDITKALSLTRERVAKKIEEGKTPLSPYGLTHLASVMQLCVDAANDRVPDLSRIHEKLQEVFAETNAVTIKGGDGCVLVNGEQLDWNVLGPPAREFIGLLSKHNGEGITIASPVTKYEIRMLAEALTTRKVGAFVGLRWDTWFGLNNVSNIYIDQKVCKPRLIKNVPPQKQAFHWGKRGPLAGREAKARSEVVSLKPQPPQMQTRLRSAEPVQAEPEAESATESPAPPTKEVVGPLCCSNRILSAEAISLIKESVAEYVVRDKTEALMRSIDMVQERLSSPEQEVRMQAAGFIEEFLDLAASHSSEALLDSVAMMLQSGLWVTEKLTLATRLAELAQRAISLATKLKNQELAKRIIWSLRTVNPRDRFVRIELQLAVEKLARGGVLDTLIKNLSSSDIAYARGAAGAIACIGGPAVPRLVNAIKTCPSFRVRQTCAEALTWIESSSGKLVLDSLGSQSSDRECDNVMDVFSIFSKDLSQDMCYAVVHPNPRVRIRAVQLLPHVREQWADWMLIQLAMSDDPHLACEALKVIGDTGNEEAGERLLSILPALTDQSVQRECYVALGKLHCKLALRVLKKAASGKLLGFLGGRKQDVREAASWAIGEIGNDGADIPLN